MRLSASLVIATADRLAVRTPVCSKVPRGNSLNAKTYETAASHVCRFHITALTPDALRLPKQPATNGLVKLNHYNELAATPCHNNTLTIQTVISSALVAALLKTNNLIMTV